MVGTYLCKKTMMVMMMMMTVKGSFCSVGWCQPLLCQRLTPSRPHLHCIALHCICTALYCTALYCIVHIEWRVNNCHHHVCAEANVCTAGHPQQMSGQCIRKVTNMSIHSPHFTCIHVACKNICSLHMQSALEQVTAKCTSCSALMYNLKV